MHGRQMPQLETIPCIKRISDDRLNTGCPASIQEIVTRESAGGVGRVAEGRDSCIPRKTQS